MLKRIEIDETQFEKKIIKKREERILTKNSEIVFAKFARKSFFKFSDQGKIREKK